MKSYIVILCVLMCGCEFSVRSREPFYTESLKVETPDIVGEWDWQTQPANDTGRKTVSTWIFDSDYGVRIYDTKGRSDGLVVPFKVQERLYCDILNREEGLHTLYRMSFSNHTVRLVPLNGEWLTNALGRAEVRLPIQYNPSNQIFTASSPVWVQLLQEQAANPNILANSSSLELKKAAGMNFLPRRRS